MLRSLRKQELIRSNELKNQSILQQSQTAMQGTGQETFNTTELL